MSQSKSKIRNLKSEIRTRERAFTLVEVLLTIAILATAMTIISSVLVSSIEARDRIEESIARYEVGPAILRIMTEDIRGAFIPHDAPADKEFFVSKSVTAGMGNIDRLDFVSSRNSYDDEKKCESDVTELGYQLLPNYEESSLYRLMRREDPFIDDKPTTGGALAQLHDRVKSVKYEFFDGQEWLPEWNNTKKSGKLPEAIRVEIVLSMPQLSSISETEEYEPTFSTVISLPK